MNETILSVKNLSIGYQSKTIANAISFQMQPGELMAVVGSNGIGKSTLLRTLTGLQPKISGEITLLGVPIEKIPISERAKKLAMVLTDPVATKNLTVQELIALGRQPHTNWLGKLSENDHANIQFSMVQCNIQNLTNKKCLELSDGQFQKVLIARALAQETPILALDEPTTHLDLSNKVDVLKLLHTIARQNNKAVLMTTHEINMAIQLCDKIFILDGGENPFGAPHELIDKGCFNRIFSKGNVKFDKLNQRFEILK